MIKNRFVCIKRILFMCFHKKYTLTILFFLCISVVRSQVIEPTSSLHNVDADKYYHIHYDNDFFGNADYYYTQGINFSYVHPKLKNFPLSKLLWQPKNSSTKYGVALDFFGYTPTSIRAGIILEGDRPYAGAIAFQSFAIGVDTVHKQRISSTFHIGVIGPAALGNEIQTGIHKTIGRPLPQGWKYQVKNDLILNYELDYEKKLLGCKNIFLLSGLGAIRAGTLNTNATAATNIMLGNFKDPFGAIRLKDNARKKFTYYIFGQSKVNFIGYDASLQGGVFNRKSVYTIPASHLSRCTFQQTAGFAFTINKVLITYSKSKLTREFSSGKSHKWGGISIGVAL